MSGPQVATPQQAQLLLNVELRPLFSILMHGALSATEVAHQLGVSVKRAHYLLTRLRAAGVIEEVSQERRAGRPIRRYRTAERWFIPFAATGADTMEAFVEAQVLPRMARFVRLSVLRLQAYGPAWGYWLERGEQLSTLRMGDQADQHRPGTDDAEPFLLNIGTAHLTLAQAQDLKRRLQGVIDEFAPLEDLTSPAYTIGLLLVRGDVE